MIRFKSFTKLLGLAAALAMLMLAGHAQTASAQSNEGPGFNASADSLLRFGNNVMTFQDVFVGDISETKFEVLTTNLQTITLNHINVREPFVETECTCNFAGVATDCDNESLPLDIPPLTTCNVGIAFEPQFAGKVVKRRGIGINFNARNSPKRVRLVGFGVD